MQQSLTTSNSDGSALVTQTMNNSVSYIGYDTQPPAFQRLRKLTKPRNYHGHQPMCQYSQMLYSENYKPQNVIYWATAQKILVLAQVRQNPLFVSVRKKLRLLSRLHSSTSKTSSATASRSVCATMTEMAIDVSTVSLISACISHPSDDAINSRPARYWPTQPYKVVTPPVKRGHTVSCSDGSYCQPSERLLNQLSIVQTARCRVSFPDGFGEQSKHDNPVLQDPAAPQRNQKTAATGTKQRTKTALSISTGLRSSAGLGTSAGLGISVGLRASAGFRASVGLRTPSSCLTVSSNESVLLSPTIHSTPPESLPSAFTGITSPPNHLVTPENCEVKGPSWKRAGAILEITLLFFTLLLFLTPVSGKF